MLSKKRNRKNSRKKIAAYFLFLLSIGLVLFSLYFFIFFPKQSFISPVVDFKGGEGKILEELLNKNNISYASISSSSDSSYVILLTKGGKITFSSKKEISEQITSLQRILRELTIEGKGFKSIDFRFGEPIIVF